MAQTCATTLSTGEYFHLAAAHSGHVMHVPDASMDANVQLIQNFATTDTHDNWRLEEAPTTGHYYIFNENSGLALAVEGASLSNGADIVQAPVDPASSQWCFQPVGDNPGFYNIMALHSGQGIDVSGASLNTGATLVQWPLKVSGNNDNQEWELLSTILPTLPPGAPEWEYFPLPIVPSASANLPDGRVLFWSAYAKMNWGGQRGETWVSILDPETGAFTEALIANTQHDMFCPGTAILADGRVMVTGGSADSKTTFYDQATDTWSAGDEMNIGRGYHSSKLCFPPYIFVRPRGIILTLYLCFGLTNNSDGTGRRLCLYDWRIVEWRPG
jgi:galactose oxidase